jgi:transcriptional regulator with XRE-family HTH domain
MRNMPRSPSTHVDDARSVGRRLREARVAAGVSQRSLAAVGCTAAYVSRIESGERIPSLQLIHAFARVLGVTPEWLATGVEVPGAQELVEAEVALRLGELDEAEALFSERLKEEPRNAVALAGLGLAAFRREQLPRAIDLLERALEARTDSIVAAPSAVEALARAYAATGALEASVALLKRAVDEAAELGAVVEGLRFRVLLANALIDSGSVGRAERILADAIRGSDELRDPIAAARVFWTQSRLHTHPKDPKLGARYARRALEILERTEDDAYVAMAYHLLAYAEIEAGNPDAALEHLDEGRRRCGSNTPARDEARFAIEETRALLALDRLQDAARSASRALGKLHALEPADQGRAYVLLGDVFHRSGDRERAIELLELAVELLETSGRPYLLEAAGKLADVLEEAGHSDRAFAVLRSAVAAGKSESRV